MMEEVRFFEVSPHFLRKTFGEDLGKGGAVHFSKREGDNIIHKIYHTPKTPPRVKVHEVGHVLQGQKLEGDFSLGEVALRELEAEIFSYEVMGKKITWRVALRPMANLLNQGLSQEESVRLISSSMESLGYPLSSKDLSRILEFSDRAYEENWEF